MYGLRRPAATGALILLLGLLPACSDVAGPGDGVEPITELPRALTLVEAEVIERSNEFGLTLLREVVARDARPNIVLSPLSASMALGMTLNGAGSTTFDAMRATLGFETLEQPDINDAYRALIDLLTALDPSVRFDIANAVWAREGVPFHQAFFDALREAFDARAEVRDFSDPATVDEINGWVQESTDGLIERIIDNLEPDLVMLLVNAIYFDGAWTYQFDPEDTRRQAFQRSDGSTVDVDMMSIVDAELGLGGGVVGGIPYSSAELPYGGEAFAMTVVVPQDDLRAFVGGLDPDAWSGIVEGFSEVEVDGLSMPKFTLSYDTFLNEALQAMGMEVAFGPGADFTRMSPLGDGLCISYVRQKTFVEVDERGTKAAAVTAVGIGPTSFLGLIVDRPFLFAIRERLSGTILFVGIVDDPTAEDPGAEPFENLCM